MARQKKLQGAGQTALLIALVVAVAVLVNLISGAMYGRADLTEHGINLLSDASKDAVRELDGLEMRVYISPDIPDEIPSPQPGAPPMKLLGVPQKLRDKIEEYKAVAGSGLTVTYVKEHVVEEAKKAKLKTFRGKGATVSDEGVELNEYVLGLTLHYKNAMETFDLALWPDVYEFEITKRLLRLKDKADNAIKMKDVLRAGENVADAVKKCNDTIDAALPKDKPGEQQNLVAMLSGEATTAKVTALKAAQEDIAAACGPVKAELDKAQSEKGKHEQLDRVLLVAGAFNDGYEQITEALSSEDAQTQAQALQQMPRLLALGRATDSEHDDLVDSPGRRRVGFVCNGTTFCPFPDDRPLVPQEMMQALQQQNQILGQVMPALSRMQDEMNQIMAQVNQSLFRGRGFDIVRIDLDEKVPDDVRAMVVFGPKGTFTDYQLYQMDQFVMKGGSLVVFLNPWDIDIMGYTAKGEPKLDPSQWVLKKNGSNIGELLASYGIEPGGGLVADPSNHGQIALMVFAQTGQGFIPLQMQAFPYPLIPTFTDFDREDPLVRATSSVTLPFTTSLKLAPKQGETLTALVSSSKSAITVDDPKFPLDPIAQKKALTGKNGDGPYVVVASASGTLPSHFAGKDAPKAPDADKPEDPAKPEADKDKDPAKEVLEAQNAKKDAGTGRVLVLGSNLGLEPLSREAIFEGFNIGKLTGQDFSIIEDFRQYQANYRNWSTKVQEVQHTLQDNLQLLSNALDWSIQRDALVELRAKQVEARPLEPTDEGDQSVIQATGVALPAALFLLAGLGYVLWRRARQRRLTL
ncbi:MAG: Gldg family protein [Myxococcales bacterium]|nr:Gldg family protein [Myxococcales bacterium]MCB9731324.1 Gldg family protein [Deltaproteobacteria bacterium]